MIMKILFNLFSKYLIRILIFFIAYNYVLKPLNQGIKDIFFLQKINSAISNTYNEFTVKDEEDIITINRSPSQNHQKISAKITIPYIFSFTLLSHISLKGTFGLLIFYLLMKSYTGQFILL